MVFGISWSGLQHEAAQQALATRAGNGVLLKDGVSWEK